MELFYLPESDQQDQPADFMPGASPILRLPEAAGWKREGYALHQLNSQHHAYVSPASIAHPY